MDKSNVLFPLNPATLQTARLDARTRIPILRFGLSTRLLLIVIAVSLIGVLSSSLLLVNWHSTQLIESAELAMSQLSAPVKASLQHAMLTNDEVMINAVMQSLAQEPTVQRIRILDESGMIRRSSSPFEVGQQTDRTTAECQACHQGTGAKDKIAKMSALVDTPSSQFLVNVSPIANDTQCHGCHDPQIKNLGILMIETPVKDLYTQIRESSWHISLAALFTFVLLVGLMVPILRGSITNPIAELSKGVAEIGSENLDYPMHASSHDEIGNLATGLEAMRKQLKISRTEMEHRNRELAVLYQVALVTGQLLEIDKILAQVLETIIDKLELKAGIIYLWDRTKDRFERRVSQGHPESRLREIEERRHMPGGDLTFEIAQSGEAFFVPDKSTNSHFVQYWGKPSVSSYLNIPLTSKGNVIGTMELTSPTGQLMTERQVEILKAVGQQVGIAIENNSLLNETRRGVREATTLYQLGTKISSSLELDQVVDAVAEGACRALATDLGIVGLVDEEHRELCLKAIAGTYVTNLKGMRLPLPSEHVNRASGVGKIINLECPSEWPAPIAHLAEAEQIKSLLSVPLWRGEHLHGVVAVLTRTPRRFEKEEVHLLTRLAQQVIVAIENARLYQQVRYLAVLEERDRLAREMHDNLAQELGYLDLKTTITKDLLASGQLEQVAASLLELKRVTREAYTDTREAIFGLRNVVSLGTELAPVLREYLAEYRAHYGLDTRLILEDESLAQFRPQAGVQIHHIIKEALTNVRKHAKATRAWIRFEREGDLIRITVEDDGKGFDPMGLERDERQRFGIEIMRERAGSIGATIECISRANQGTRVVIRVPITAVQPE